MTQRDEQQGEQRARHVLVSPVSGWPQFPELKEEIERHLRHVVAGIGR